MFHLKSLELKNFLSYEYASLNFSRPGLYVVSGYSEKGGDSNGSGKSAIFSAISYALFNRTNTGLTGEAITRFGSKKIGEVTLGLTNESGQEYQIVRTPKSVQFTIDGKPIEGHKRDIQQSINEAFKTDFYSFNNCISFSQRSGNLLTSTSDADKKQFLKNVLGLEKLDEAQEKIIKIYDDLQRKYDELAREISIATPTLRTYQSQLIQAKLEDASFEDQKHKRIATLQDKKGRTLFVENNINTEEYEKIFNKSVQNSEKAKIIEDRLKEDLRKCYDDKARTQGEIERLTESLNASQSMRGLICDLCGATINRKNLAIHKKEKQIVIEQQRAMELECYAQVQKLEQDIQTISSIYSIEQVAKNDLLKAKQTKEIYDRELELYHRELLSIDREIEEAGSIESPYLSLRESLEARISGLLEDLEKYEKGQAEVSSKIDIYGFLRWVLSREGVASYIIEHSFGRLETLANHYLSKICSEKFLVEIKPQRELKSKVLKEEIDIIVTTEGKRILYAGLSDGQRQRLNIALLFSIYRLCKDSGVSAFDMLLLDEALDLSLGHRGQEDIVRMLQVLKDEIFHIIVISHKEEISKDFDYEIMVRRDSTGISKIL